jgi:hypothetical protein
MAKPEPTVQELEDRLWAWHAQNAAKAKAAKQREWFPSTLDSDRKHISPLGGVAAQASQSGSK